MLLKPLALGLGLLALVLLALLWSNAPPARADGPTTCTVCLDGSCDYADIQAAVDADTCQEVKVAQGVYSGVQARPAPAGYPSPPASGLITQVVHVSRTVTVRGGYTTTNWTTPYPLTQPTTLDAGGLGRVLVIAGDISPTIEGLGMTGGNMAELSGLPWGGRYGGGVYIISATATLSACRVFDNFADEGGGLYLDHSSATLISNSVTSNSAYDGGGMSLDSSPATLISNNFTFNEAAFSGGGLYLASSPATLISNRVAANSAGFDGGGLLLFASGAMLSANSVVANTASEYGGGLNLDNSNPTLTNTVIADNRVSAHGSGLHISWNSTPRLVHTTIAYNSGGDGSGLHIGDAHGGAATAWLTNTILVSQTVGITVAEGSTAQLSGTLWYGNSTDWGGAGAIFHSGDTAGPPAFVDPGSGDYHIRVGSAAIDRGVDAGVATDKDGLPCDARPDLGAYEFQGLVIDTYLPVIRKNAR